jgi:hypothetical protein
MILAFLIFGAATIALFLLYSRKVGSVVNSITIFTGMKIAIEFIFEPIGFILHLFDYDVWSMFIINLLSFCGYAAFIIGLLIVPNNVSFRQYSIFSKHLPAAWMFLFGAWLIYLPVLIEFRVHLTDPRRIYELTRTGYGLYTFGSALLTFIAYILFQMSSQRRALIFYVVILSLVALKGTKGQFIVLLSIWIISKLYIYGFKYSLTKSAIFLSTFAVIGMYVFALNFRGDIENIFVSISEYSDYNRNGAFIVGSDTFGYYDGRLTAESQWISKIPRALWPEKPKVFGEFRLAQQYYPQWFMLDQGSPSFGIGIYFADFGWLAFVIYPLSQFVIGYLLARCLNRLETRPNVFYFIMSVYFSGNNLFSSGSGNYAIEHAVIGLAVLTLLRIAGNRPTHNKSLSRTSYDTSQDGRGRNCGPTDMPVLQHS